MKLFKYILCLFCAISLTACHQDEKQDFWEATIDAVQSKSKDNAYLKNNWNIGISSDEGKKHQNMAARYIVENDNETTTTIFALQNQNDKEYISYTYTTDVIEDTKEYQKTITINSTNKKYTKYDIQYNYYEFENGNYTYGEDATGSISINKDGITYDNVPLLNEAIQTVVETGQASTSFIQRRFKVGYARAGRIIDQMEERGVISGYQGSKPRQVLMTLEKLQELKMGTNSEEA